MGIKGIHKGVFNAHPINESVAFQELASMESINENDSFEKTMLLQVLCRSVKCEWAKPMLKSFVDRKLYAYTYSVMDALEYSIGDKELFSIMHSILKNISDKQYELFITDAYGLDNEPVFINYFPLVCRDFKCMDYADRLQFATSMHNGVPYLLWKSDSDYTLATIEDGQLKEDTVDQNVALNAYF